MKYKFFLLTKQTSNTIGYYLFIYYNVHKVKYCPLTNDIAITMTMNY